MSEISLVGVSKAKVLAELYNNSTPRGMGHLVSSPNDMTEEEAEKILSSQTNFDYLEGRVMKVNLSGDSFDPWLYDRDNGQGLAAQIVQNIRDGVS